MFKKILVIGVIAYVFCNLNVAANHINVVNTSEILNNYNILNESDIMNTEAVTREECITAIMKAIGLTDKKLEHMNGSDIIGFVDCESFTYIDCAYSSKIAYGEEHNVDYMTPRIKHTHNNTDIFFFPDRPVTAKECLAFMVRCFEDGYVDYDLTLEKAKEYNLIEGDVVW